MESTNYYNTFIEIAEDCPIDFGEVPPSKVDKKSIANYQFDMIGANPYKYNSDDVIFTVYAIRNGIPEGEWGEARKQFFSKGQPCLRSSPLTKRYGWGIHHDAEGRVAMYPAESKEYQAYLQDDSIKKTKAMRSKRA